MLYIRSQNKLIFMEMDQLEIEKAHKKSESQIYSKYCDKARKKRDVFIYTTQDEEKIKKILNSVSNIEYHLLNNKEIIGRFKTEDQAVYVLDQIVKEYRNLGNVYNVPKFE